MGRWEIQVQSMVMLHVPRQVNEISITLYEATEVFCLLVDYSDLSEPRSQLLDAGSRKVDVTLVVLLRKLFVVLSLELAQWQF